MRCKKRFTTYERIEMTPTYVIKKDGRRERFDREKLKKGIVKALEKRPINLEKIDEMIDDIEEKIRQLGEREVKTSIIGEFVMESLKKIDKVGYIRFASVYKPFTDIISFEKEVKNLSKNEKEGKDVKED